MTICAVRGPHGILRWTRMTQPRRTSRRKRWSALLDRRSYLRNLVREVDAVLFCRGCGRDESEYLGRNGREETTRVVGIDLGTTNSLVAYMQGDQPVVIPGEDGSKLVPSVVAMPAAGRSVSSSAMQRART